MVVRRDEDGKQKCRLVLLDGCVYVCYVFAPEARKREVSKRAKRAKRAKGQKGSRVSYQTRQPLFSLLNFLFLVDPKCGSKGGEACEADVLGKEYSTYPRGMYMYIASW
jgi:hypothetical protein